jgi:outer membrane protein with beta-barrel domain
MNTKLGKIWSIGCLLSVGCVSIADAQTQTQERHSGSRIEACTFFGAIIAGKEISRGVNATGGEQLIARLNHGGALGLRGGVHSDLIGLEANLITTGNRAAVENEFGVAFPNHAERPLIYSGDALLYPFRRAIREGKVRPYLTSGVGGMLLSADLDNIRDKETHGSLIWNAGGGVKVFVGEGTGLYVDIRFTNHRLLNSRGADSIDLRSVSIGVGARF